MKALLALFALCMLSSASQSEDWYPSRYGSEDSLGALNLLSSKDVVAASRLVKTGKTYALGVITGRNSPAFGTRAFNLVVMPGGDGSVAGLGTNQATFNDDFLASHLGIGTQIDGLIETLAQTPFPADSADPFVAGPLGELLNHLAFETEIDLAGSQEKYLACWVHLHTARGAEPSAQAKRKAAAIEKFRAALPAADDD